MKKSVKKIIKSRITILGVILFGMAAMLVGRLYELQIVNGEKYAENFMLKTKKEIKLKGMRGNIYDRNGKSLARNRLVYAIKIEDNQKYETNRERQLSLNGKIYQLLQILKQNGDSTVEYLDIHLDSKENYSFTVEGSALMRFRADIYGEVNTKAMTKAQQEADAEDIIRYLCSEERFCVYSQEGKKYSAEEKKQYGLPDQLPKEDILKLLNIRYALSLQAYQKYRAVTIAENVSENTVAAIMENESEFTGISIEEEAMRVYDGGEACASILGYTGQISSEELEEKEKDGYTADAVIGKAGMEKYLEETLHGEDGYKEILVDNMGRILATTGKEKQPQTGQDVWLSIDVDLQQKVYEILENKITDILLEHMIDAKSFHKEGISDTTQIQIPVYDVYSAFFSNHILDIEHFQEDDATNLEKKIYKKHQKEKEKICKKLESYLLKEDNDVTQEAMQEYEAFILENVTLIYEEKEKEAQPYYNKWKEGEYSIYDYLNKMISNGWIKQDIFDEEENYLTQKEMYNSVIRYVIRVLQNENEAFDILVYKDMVLHDKITPEEIGQLLYDQKFLTQKDDIYKKWKKGEISSCAFFRTKIKNKEITPADLALDPCSGSAVVTDTNTGEIIACVSYPGYDNNRLANQMDDTYYNSLSQNRSLPLYNRATQQLCAPGSTFKPITLIAGLEEGVIESETTIFCDGVFDKVSPYLRCWNHAGHGSVTSVAAALRHSCNDYLCDVSYRLGQKGKDTFSDTQALHSIQKYAAMFCLDEKSGIELGESSPQVTDSYAIPSAIGQGTNNYATVQLARYVTILANKGDCYKLTLIKNNKSDKDTIHLSQQTWKEIHKGMEMYIENTGIFKGFTTPVAGKSGTAQENRMRPDHGLFIGYAPANAPQIAIAVRIVNGYTSENAVSCGREIFEAYFQKK